MGKNLSSYNTVFTIPFGVLGGIVTYFLLGLFPGTLQLQEVVILLAIAIGSFQLVVDSIKSILEKSLALDYIAIAAISLGLITHEFIAAAIIVLMMSGGNALEKYATYRAKSSLQKLRDRVPNLITLLKDGQQTTIDIAQVRVGDIILVRKGEVIGLDGTLNSTAGSVDESSLTGESAPVDKVKNDLVRSGTVNIGDPIEIVVAKPAAESTYKKITDMVMQAQSQKTRFIRLADKYSLWFTAVTFSIAALTFLVTQSPERVLAVLVIATPCPLILATPVALIGGVNSAAAKNIVIKNMAVLEMVDECKAVIFDKTGTLTIGQPQLVAANTKDDGLTSDQILSIAAALERNSLHPFAKSIVQTVSRQNLPQLSATNIQEIIGQGISGEIDGQNYRIAKAQDLGKTAVELWRQDELIGEILFADVIKTDAKDAFQKLRDAGYAMIILSGDKQARVAQLAAELGENTEYKSDVLPEEKLEFIKNKQTNQNQVMMIGDGINDAPALAAADVGVVFSHEEYTASAAAGDVILLKNDVNSILELVSISQSTIQIAKQSILAGLGLSVLGMCFASFGLIVPVVGAIIQELIDVGVIFNSLRTSRIN